ncbi:MAG: LytR family transcriptional regulator [Ruminococcaceae bacterium]|nr:LytR family transcriptional regulator [Oscillospiraceae bacterium]
MATTPAKKPTPKKKKNNRGRIVLTVLMVVLIVLASLLIYKIGRAMYDAYIGGSEEEPDTSHVNPVIYETTPVAQSTKVGYYLLGVMGEEDAQSETDLLSLVCFDKEKKTVRILQMPQDTYLGEDDTFKVKRLSEVFASPQDLLWCNVCRCRVYKPAVSEESTHTECGTKLTAKEGSSTVNLVEVFNRQYGLPIDGYFIFEQDTLRKLVDLIGGVTVDLAFSVKTDEVTYEKGVRAIDGAAALKYIAASGNGTAKDIERFARFQQVCTAVLQRLFAMEDTKMSADVFQPLMVGSTPIRVGFNDDYKSIVELVRALSAVPFEEMAAYVLPGETVSEGGETYYSVHRNDVLALLNREFNPHGDPITEGDLNLTELAGGKESDLTATLLSQWVLEQETLIVKTEE